MKSKHTKFNEGLALSKNVYTERSEVKGFTLVEILIFTAIVSVFFVVAVYVSSFSLSIMRTNENKVYATHYAEEASEWLLNQKDSTDWLTFSGHAGTTWCMNTLDWATTGACPPTYLLGPGFNREVVLTDLGSGSISSTVTVSWKDVGGVGANVLYVPIKTIYAQTE